MEKPSGTHGNLNGIAAHPLVRHYRITRYTSMSINAKNHVLSKKLIDKAWAGLAAFHKSSTI